MRQGLLLISEAGAELQKLCCLTRPLREQARSHIWNAFPCGSEPARESNSPGDIALQNDRTIRPNVSIAFSESSVHGLP